MNEQSSRASAVAGKSFFWVIRRKACPLSLSVKKRFADIIVSRKARFSLNCRESRAILNLFSGFMSFCLLKLHSAVT